jgi:hypothetical protein
VCAWRRTAEILDEEPSETYPGTLTATLRLVFDQLANDNPAALDLLRLAAQLAPEPIPFTLFTDHSYLLPHRLAEARDPVAFHRIIGILRRRSLAEVDGDSLQVHRLVQAILRGSPINRHAVDKMPLVARQLLQAAAPDDPGNEPESWPVWRQLLPHVLAVTDCDPDPSDPDVLPWLLHHAATYLHARGEPEPAVSTSNVRTSCAATIAPAVTTTVTLCARSTTMP